MYSVKFGVEYMHFMLFSKYDFRVCGCSESLTVLGGVNSVFARIFDVYLPTWTTCGAEDFHALSLGKREFRGGGRVLGIRVQR